MLARPEERIPAACTEWILRAVELANQLGRRWPVRSAVSLLLHPCAMICLVNKLITIRFIFTIRMCITLALQKLGFQPGSEGGMMVLSVLKGGKQRLWQTLTSATGAV
jgi:hypothetical protein